MPGPFMIHSMFTGCSSGDITSCTAVNCTNCQISMGSDGKPVGTGGAVSKKYFGPGNPMPTPGNYIWILYEGSITPTDAQIGSYGMIAGFTLTTFRADHGLGKAV